MMFPEKLPGIGGYAAFGLSWEEGVELPIGLTKKVIGYPRVGINCALCHTTRYRTHAGITPMFVPTGPGHTANVEALSKFLYECAKDPRFESDNILAQIQNFTKLDWIDLLLYRFLIIPATKERIVKGGEHFLWTYRKEFPAWGRGSDGPSFSLVYARDDARPDAHYGSNQFPAVWNLVKYQGKNHRGESQRLNVTGDGRDAQSVVHDSIAGLLGSSSHPGERVGNDARVLTAYLERTPAPSYPYDREDGIQPEAIAAGKLIFERACAGCHGLDSALVGRLMPLDAIGTDPDYATRRSKAGPSDYVPGYVVPHLDGIWLRAPYLHNGSVPSLRDLLTPASQRPTHFYRGYDVLDRKNLGFVSQAGDGQRSQASAGFSEVERHGSLFDTTRKGNGNQGHEYGSDLSETEKRSLIEFMKTL
jgi:mono/diheme cytochrome c family protein